MELRSLNKKKSKGTGFGYVMWIIKMRIQDLGGGLREKEKGEGRSWVLKLNDGEKCHNILLARGKRCLKIYTSGVGSHHCHEQEEEVKISPTLLPFVRPGLLHLSIFCRKLYDLI